MPELKSTHASCGIKYPVTRGAGVRTTSSDAGGTRLPAVRLGHPTVPTIYRALRTQDATAYHTGIETHVLSICVFDTARG